MDAYEHLYEVAASLNEYQPPEFTVPPPSGGGGDGEPGGRPGDDFNARADWEQDVIGPWGWRRVARCEGKWYWCRPGKREGTSATTGYCKGEIGGDLFYVFSTNAYPFQAEQTYSKFAAYTLLCHGGDFAASTRALRAKGYGDRGPELLRGGRTSEPERADAETSDDPLDQDATAADLVASQAVIRWRWEGWLPIGSLTILASEPGVGKTRLCADLLRRVYNGLPWPDGKEPTCPKGSCVLWVPADNQHAELGTMPQAFGFPPEALYLNATRRNPFAGTMLDDKDDLKDFERRILRVQPALVFVDTSLNATDRTAHKPEDAKAFFVPLQQLAARTQTVVVCVTHLNAAGKPLGRRIEGQGRVVLMLERPDPEGQPLRRKLYVRKSHSLYPPPLGVTMGGSGNEYDGNPPQAPDDGPRLVKSGKVGEAREWLHKKLEGGPQAVRELRLEASAKGISSTSLYRAREELGVVEYKQNGRLFWRFPAPEDEPPDRENW